MNDRKKDRGFYKPKSYRFSEETNKAIKKLAQERGSQEKALRYLLLLYKKYEQRKQSN